MKNALITGGTGGIGTELCRAFVESGYKVIATHNGKTNEFLNGWLDVTAIDRSKIKFINCDITNRKMVQEEISNLLKNTKVDVLVNNAGITSDATFLKMTYEQWENVIDVNLKSLFEITKLVCTQMVGNNKGSIINITSVNGLKGQFGQTNYSAAKAGIIGFTKALALETARYGVTVNAIAPGYAGTPMVAAIKQEILDKILSNVPTKNLVSLEEIAKTALFLADDISSITGETISINGGLYMQ